MPLQISYADAPEKRNHNESRLPQRTHGSGRKALPVFEALLLSRLCRQDCGDCTAKTALHSGMRSFLPDRRSQFHNVHPSKEAGFLRSFYCYRELPQRTGNKPAAESVHCRPLLSERVPPSQGRIPHRGFLQAIQTLAASQTDCQTSDTVRQNILLLPRYNRKSHGKPHSAVHPTQASAPENPYPPPTMATHLHHVRVPRRNHISGCLSFSGQFPGQNYRLSFLISLSTKILPCRILMPATGRKRDIFLLRRNAVPTAWISSQETNACSRSAISSSTCSSPTDRRSRVSVMPSFSLHSFGTSGWVCFIG